MRFISVDPALRNFGVVVGRVEGCKNFYIDETFTLQTDAKYSYRKRAEYIVNRLSPYVEKAEIMFVEQPHGSQSAAAAWSLGVVLGIIVTLDIPKIYVSANEAKNFLKKGAKKDEIIEWATKQHPEIKWKIYRGNPAKNNEHVADALLIAYAAWEKYLGQKN